MKIVKNRTRLLSTTIIGGLAAIAMASPALAQNAPQPAPDPDEEAQEVDEIVVTGSRIARSNFTSESPITVISAEELQQSGSVQVGEVIRQQLASVPSGGFNPSSNLSGGGALTVDLRGLGPDRTLNLINGRRVASFADNLQNEAADLSFIPGAMIDRVEVLRDGASAVYGADAVTGVVNVILKNDFEGFDVSAQYGISDYGDYEQYQVQVVTGGNFERGNAVVALEYQSTALVPQRDRDWAIPTIAGLTATGVTNGSGAHPGGTINFLASGGLPAQGWCTKPKALGGDEITNVFGTTNCPGSALSDPDELIGRYDYALVQSLLNGADTWNAAFFGNYDLTASMSAFVEMQYSNRQGESVLDGNPIFAGSGSVFYPGGWVVPGDNPYNPYPGQSAQVTQRPTSTIGPRNQYIDGQSVRFVAGLKGQLWDWDWELSYINAKVTSVVTVDSTWNLARAIRISDPDLCAADPICVASLKPGSLGALDVYRPGNWSESEIAYMRQVATSNSDFDLEGVSGVISGEVFSLPAGPLGMALGFDYREENVSVLPDAVTVAGESIANQTFPTAGGFDVLEFYTEVNLPLLRDVWMAQDVSLNLQGRWFEYSNFGSDSVYKIGYNHTFNDDLRLRASYGTSFRQPTLVDVFSGGTVSFAFLFDPCDTGGGLRTGTDAAALNAQANCASTGPLGVPNPGAFTQSAAQLPVLQGGDLADGTFDLLPETADTFTVGLLFTPEVVPGLDLSVDYWSINLESFITNEDIQVDVLDDCYGSANFSAPSCARFSATGFRRDPTTGQLQGLAAPTINLTDIRVETSGWDWSARYAFDLWNGRMVLDHQGTFVLDYAGIQTIPVGTYAGTSGVAIPEYRLNFGANYDVGAWGFGAAARYTPAIDDISVRGTGINPKNYDEIEDLWIIDARLRWAPTDTLNLVAGINNVMNEEPPYAFNTGANAAVGLHHSAVVGRYYFLRLTKSF